ncbi:WHG domain-containing protein, partial [Mycobacteriaceae bacterium Msp059]|nr:WHG domain-containing protein [Mycobacteriaceae bacterium Msp059]
IGIHRDTGLFRAMFAEPCDPTSPERVAAVDAISAYLKSIVQQAIPASDPDAMAKAVWALVHGLAFLHLDGKFDASSPDTVAATVRATVSAALGQLT